MKKFLKISLVLMLLISAVLIIDACKEKEEKKVSDPKSLLVLVDETLMPIMEDQVAVFESDRPVKVSLIGKSESEIINLLQRDTTRLAVLTRVLNSNEERVFQNKKIKPKITPIAIDGIALIVNKKYTDSIIDLQSVIDFMQGKNVANIEGLVFDNANSSTINYMNSLANTKTGENKSVFALKNNNDVIKYISENDGYIGVVGVNWLTQPTPDMEKYTNAVSVLAVKNVKTSDYPNEYFKPTQANIGAGTYPLVRKIYMLNYEGSAGLGMSFATFVAGSIGQKIILKSGIAPIKEELREVKVRKEINTQK